MKLHVGIDDTDSTKAGCTTHLAFEITKELRALNVQFLDYPNLIRLNPNVPYKTRGNGAVALRMNVSKESYGQVREVVLRHVERGSEIGEPRTDPGVVFLRGEVPKVVCKFSKRLLAEVVDLEAGFHVLKWCQAEAFGYGTGLGILGALGAIGNQLIGDHTYEIIVYRKPRNVGSQRKIDAGSVFQMDRETRPLTFNNIDSDSRRVLITPHGPDPVLCGIRGESHRVVLDAFRRVRLLEVPAGWIIYRANHGTGEHLDNVSTSRIFGANQPVVLKGQIIGAPNILRGGHVIFQVRAADFTIRCTAFAPTGGLARACRSLVDGDTVEVAGGTRERAGGLTINLEKLHILKLAKLGELRNPVCRHCGKRMKSAGRGQGFKCGRCGLEGRNIRKYLVNMGRALSPGTYLPRPKAMRHLAKPLQREELSSRWNQSLPISPWLSS